MGLPKHREYFKKCEEFTICALRCDKGWIGTEHVQKVNGLYYYCIHGTGKFAVPFQEDYVEIKPKDFFNVKKYLNNHAMFEAFEDFYWIGFNRLPNENRDWDGRLIREDVLTVEKESWMICFDGHPVVNEKELSRFDYAKLTKDNDYTVSLNGGVLGLFTKLVV